MAALTLTALAVRAVRRERRCAAVRFLIGLSGSESMTPPFRSDALNEGSPHHLWPLRGTSRGFGIVCRPVPYRWAACVSSNARPAPPSSDPVGAGASRDL